ncbi:hypothetical protein IMZ16_04120 [Cruoricaptor ignavus]|uniref:Uncharacterized protein n=1 Tax=Cruoricaptor ignavus TaxID=1118202 RepID=A0A7M1T5Q2_9FLAO|nr:hypothetical protein [Cruoricaptor ignavus]QOR74627.1 hypothetical protein IMZ16_04120 [Cruoricaptor ignavus]
MKKILLTTAMIFSSAVFSQERLDNATILKMKDAGLSDELIQGKIKTTKGDYDLTTESILGLKKAGLSDNVITAMMIAQLESNDPTNQLFGVITSGIREQGGKLIIGEKSISKGDEIQISVPSAGKDFLSINPKGNVMNVRSIGKIAGATGGIVGAVGMGSNNIKTVVGATKVMNRAEAINRTADTVADIQNLSGNAKKIANKKGTVTSWRKDDEAYVVEVLIDNKKYDIDIREAVMMFEVKL